MGVVQLDQITLVLSQDRRTSFVSSCDDNKSDLIPLFDQHILSKEIYERRSLGVVKRPGRESSSSSSVSVEEGRSLLQPPYPTVPSREMISAGSLSNINELSLSTVADNYFYLHVTSV